MTLPARQAPRDGELIAALATGPASAGVAIVRLSGRGALAAARKLARLPEPMPARHALLRTLRDPMSGAALDRALILYFPSPASYTGEELVELHGHGGERHAAALLAAVCAAGARLAERGEFSRRAVQNGRMTLSEAEALCDLAVAEGTAALAAARAQLFGALAQWLASVGAEALSLEADVEAALLYPEEVELPEALSGRARALAERCGALRASHRAGALFAGGARVLLAGAPNAGKSTLFNLLAGSERALVDEEPGTTRDVLEARVELAGLPCTLVDTAGLRERASRLEARGMERTRAELARAHLILWLIDGAQGGAGTVLPLELKGNEERCVLVFTKRDLGCPPARLLSAHALPTLSLSAVTGEGLGALRDMIAERLCGGTLPEPGALVLTNARHAELMGRAQAAFERAAQLAELGGRDLELLGYELKAARAALEALEGRGVDERLHDLLFSRFCLGK